MEENPERIPRVGERQSEIEPPSQSYTANQPFEPLRMHSNAVDCSPESRAQRDANLPDDKEVDALLSSYDDWVRFNYGRLGFYC